MIAILKCFFCIFFTAQSLLPTNAHFVARLCSCPDSREEERADSLTEHDSMSADGVAEFLKGCSTH